MPRRSSGYHGKTQQELNAQSFGHVVDKRYNSLRWRKLAKAYLAKHPMCIADGCNRLATVCDHITAVVDGGDRVEVVADADDVPGPMLLRLMS